MFSLILTKGLRQVRQVFRSIALRRQFVSLGLLLADLPHLPQHGLGSSQSWRVAGGVEPRCIPLCKFFSNENQRERQHGS